MGRWSGSRVTLRNNKIPELPLIEAWHRKQNSVKNLMLNIRNHEARMAKVLDDKFHRGVCAGVVAETQAKKQKMESAEYSPLAELTDQCSML